MGYRSEVAYQIVLKDKKLLNEFIAKVMVLGGNVCEALKECEVIANEVEECTINFYAEDVKWYEGYPIVDGHNKLRDLAFEWYGVDDVGVNYIRIGEEVEDIEEIYEGELADWTDLRVHRSIDMGFDRYYKPVGDNLRIFDDGIKA